jgi:tetratricopeptide (TPR) repeat protein
MLSSIKENLGLILAGLSGIVIAVLGRWLKRLLDKILPSPAVTLIWLTEAIKDLRRIRPSPDKFLVLVAKLQDDPDGSSTRAVARAFLGHQGIERTQTRRVLPLSDIGSDAENRAISLGRRWLNRRNADLLIWGQVLQKEKSLMLWFTSKDATSDFQQSYYKLEGNVLGQDFAEAAWAQLVAIALSAVKPATEAGGIQLRDTLRPIVERLRSLLKSGSQFTSRECSDLRFALGVALSAVSEEERNEADLYEAVTSLSSALENIDRTREELAWANIQHYRGLALMRLGREQAGSETIENAILAFRAALDERARERVPWEWAKTQNALGIALCELSGRKGDANYLEESISAYNLALEERTFERTPVEWSSTTNNRGLTLLNIAVRDKQGASLIQDAINSFREALRGISPKTAPILWGGIHQNISIAFYHLAERQPEGGPLDEALSVWTREKVPQLWTKLQVNIARVLTRRGELDDFDEAEEVLNAALEVCSREFSPLLWGRINDALGMVLVRKAERELPIQGPLETQLIRVIDTEQPTDWITRQRDLAEGLSRLRLRGQSLNRLETAVTALSDSLSLLSQDKLPLDWADTQHNYALAMGRLGEQDDGTDYLLGALCAVNSALAVWTYEEFPFSWAIAQNTLAWILIRLGQREPIAISRFESAIAACRRALEVQTVDELPLAHARTQNNLGIAAYLLGIAQNDLGILQESEIAYSGAIKVYHAIPANRELEMAESNLRTVQVYIQGHFNTGVGSQSGLRETLEPRPASSA